MITAGGAAPVPAPQPFPMPSPPPPPPFPPPPPPPPKHHPPPPLRVSACNVFQSVMITAVGAASVRARQPLQVLSRRWQHPWPSRRPRHEKLERHTARFLPSRSASEREEAT